MFSKSVLNDIRDRISIVDFIGERVELRRAGRNFKGRCPFHNEKTPSFNVNAEKGIYHCFGCGEGGDIFQFVMKFDGMSFADAVKFLAGRAGVELPRDTDPAMRAAEDEAAKRRRFFLRANELARDHFIALLREPSRGKAAREYLQGRGISEEIWTQHFLGYADNSWDELSAHLKEKGAPLELAAELGLVKRRDGGGHYDFFRDRIIFPIVSPRGEVLGFSGRALGPDEAAKYINSPDSGLYHKSNCVYGLNLAAAAIRSLDQAILVEGNMDLVSLHQAGITNVVAPLGTALTAGHLRLLSRYTRNIVVVFDGDEAGARAALRSLEIFIEAGIMPRTVDLPAGEDPDTLVKKEGPEAFRSRVAAGQSLFEYFVERTMAATGSDAAGRAQAMGRIAPMLKLFADPVEQAIYRKLVARRLDVEESAIARTIGSPASRSVATTGGGKENERGVVVLSAERMLVETMLRRPEVIGRVFAEVAPEVFEDGWCRTAAEVLCGAIGEEGEVKIGPLIEGLEDQELAAQLRQVAMGADRSADDEVDEVIGDCIGRLKGRPVQERLEKINDAIRSAQARGDEQGWMALLAEKQELMNQTKKAANG